MQIFNKSVYHGETGGNHDINPNFRASVGGVNGILVEPPDISIPATWSTLINLDERLSTLSKYARYAGINLFTVGAFTEQFYEKSDYLKMDIKMKSVNWDGEQSVIEKSQRLYGFAAPKFLTTSKQIETTLTNTKTTMDKKEEKEEEEENISISNVINSVSKFAGFSGAPDPVTVKIGKYIRAYSMVVKNVSVNYSKELLKNGEPISAEYTISTESKKILTAGQINSIFVVNPNGSK